MSSEAGRLFNMLHTTETTILYLGPKTWWGCGWREEEGQSLTVQRKAEHDQMILYTFPWWPFSPSAIQYCIAALDPSLKHTSMVTHTYTHTQTDAPRWAASEWKNEATEKASGRKDKNGPELIVCYLSSYIEVALETARDEFISLVIHTQTQPLKEDTNSQFTSLKKWMLVSQAQ